MSDFSARIKRLRGELGGIANVARKMGVSRETIYAGMANEAEITLKTWSKLALAESDTLSSGPSAIPAKVSGVEEPQASYDTRPASVSRPAISRADIERHVARLLDLAERSPAGLGYLHRAITRHIDEETLIDMAASAIVARDRAEAEGSRAGRRHA
jgi:hypothetical protein